MRHQLVINGSCLITNFSFSAAVPLRVGKSSKTKKNSGQEQQNETPDSLFGKGN
jgi:hypothetical protein